MNESRWTRLVAVVAQIAVLALSAVAVWGQHGSSADTAASATGNPGSVADSVFARATRAAMDTMIAGMDITPSGNADADFVAQMSAHHRGAIAMAQAELRYGRNEVLERLAQEIIVTQLQEITAMAKAVRQPARGGQSPDPAAAPAAQVTHHDRVYAAEQFSNTVSVTDPADNRLLGEIRLGEPQPRNLSPLYRGQVLVHGLGFSPDHRTLVVVSIGSNSVSFIETASNHVKHITYVGRAPHEAFFTPDGREVWVTVRGEDYVAVLDAKSFREKARIKVPNGPGMQIFSPDGRYGYVCSSFTPETVVISVRQHRIVGRVRQESPFCPNIAATPDGRQVWLTLKDVGKTMVFNARPPFAVLKTLETGPITNHVNFASNANGTFAYVTVGGLNEVQVFRTSDFAKVTTIPVGRLPHGVWPSGDGSRVYVGLENADRLVAINALTNTVEAEVPIGQAPQAVVYVPDAVPEGEGVQGLQPLGLAGEAAQLSLRPVTAAEGDTDSRPPTSVALFDQGLQQVLQASVTGLEPQQAYVLALASSRDGVGTIEPLAGFNTNPAGAAIVNALGPIRQLVRGEESAPRRFLVILTGTPDRLGTAVQTEAP